MDNQGITINLNSYVIFTPNEIGIKAYETKDNTLLQFGFMDMKKPSYEKDKLPDGTLKMPLWEFMRTFGPFVGVGFDNPFTEYDIKVVKE